MIRSHLLPRPTENLPGLPLRSVRAQKSLRKRADRDRIRTFSAASCNRVEPDRVREEWKWGAEREEGSKLPCSLSGTKLHSFSMLRARVSCSGGSSVSVFLSKSSLFLLLHPVGPWTCHFRSQLLLSPDFPSSYLSSAFRQPRLKPCAIAGVGRAWDPLKGSTRCPQLGRQSCEQDFVFISLTVPVSFRKRIWSAQLLQQDVCREPFQRRERTVGIPQRRARY